MIEDIKRLRNQTGCGMSDCSKALTEANGDLELAVEILRKKGIAKAAKRDDRETSQGVIKVAVSANQQIGYLLEVNAETDFVVRNERFVEFANQALALAQEKDPADLSTLLEATMADGQTVKDSLASLSGTIGEKLEIKNYARLASTGTVAGYLHAGGTIGVLAAINGTGLSDLAYEVAMQVAAANPKYVEPSAVPQSELDKEKEVYREQLLKEGKPEAMLEKIMEGKVKKYYEEVCLIKQEYIKDDKKKIEDILQGHQIEQFIRFSL